MAESLQHKLDRVRRPRVQITYDVETNGQMQKCELPFVVGVLADLSGRPSEPLKPLKERKVVNIDRDNFNDVLYRAAPRAAIKVQDRLSGGDGKLAVELNFKHMDDFDPAKIAEQVPALRELLDMRRQMSQLLSKMEGNNKLEALLMEILANKAKAQSMAAYLGVAESAPAAEAAPAPPPEPPAGGDSDLDDLLNQIGQ